MCLSVFLLGLILYGTLCFLSLGDYFLSHVRDIFDYTLFKHFLRPFPFLFFWDPYNLDVGVLNLVPEVSETILNSLHSFFFILPLDSYLHHAIFQLTYSFFCLSYLLVPSKVFLISAIVLSLFVYSLFLLGPC